MKFPNRTRVWVHGGCWLLVYFLFWLLLSSGRAWLFGFVCALAASALSLALGLSPPRLRLRYLPSLLLFFFREILIGAWDVARRALHPRMPLDPAWVSYPLVSANPQVQLLLSAMVGLMPGTLATRVQAGQLQLHVLDRAQAWRESVAQMEIHLDRLLGDSHP